MVLGGKFLTDNPCIMLKKNYQWWLEKRRYTGINNVKNCIQRDRTGILPPQSNFNCGVGDNITPWNKKWSILWFTCAKTKTSINKIIW